MSGAGVPVTSPQLYSAGTTIDLSTSLHYIRSILPESPLHGIGFSLGASVLSRHLGETGAQSLLSSGVVLGTPWDLPKMSIKLETHWFISRVYSRAMAGNLLRLVFHHYDKDPEVFDNPGAPTAPHMATLKEMRRKGGRRLKEVDQHMVSRFGGPYGIGLWPFDGADAYYSWASPKNVIDGVKRYVKRCHVFSGMAT
jgi:predicted alpha/beta-fold hydrolase